VSARGERFWRAYALVERALVLLNRVPVGERAVTVGRERLYADSVDRLLALLSWKLGLGESEERALVARVARPGMIAVDVGANVGLHALALARLVGQGGRVHALEPEPRNRRLLERGIARARARNVLVHPVAASDKEGTLALYVSEANRGDHRTAPAPEARRALEVRAVTLDALLADEPRIDFVKIDVQGAETLVLKGARATLARSPGAGVLCELTPALLARAGSSGEELLSVLRESGLVPHRIARTGATEPISEEDALREAELSGYVNLYFARA